MKSDRMLRQAKGTASPGCAGSHLLKTITARSGSNESAGRTLATVHRIDPLDPPGRVTGVFEGMQPVYAPPAIGGLARDLDVFHERENLGQRFDDGISRHGYHGRRQHVPTWRVFPIIVRIGAVGVSGLAAVLSREVR